MERDRMKWPKLKIIAYTLAMATFSTLSPVSAADPAVYQVEKAGYVNSPQGSVEALCHPGDEAVEASCEGQFRNIASRGIDVDYPMVTEASGNGYVCKPRLLRADQVVMVIVEVTCKAGKTAKVAGRY
jgi:hypothetical protein